MTHRDQVLIEAELLNELLLAQSGDGGGSSTVKLVDASYGMGPSGFTGYQACQLERIGNAVHFDIDDIADAGHPQPHMLPDASIFAQKVAALGISSDDTVVVYDQSGMFMSAARVWWMFKSFGHKDVRVLNGGFPYWKMRGFDITSGAQIVQSGNYEAVLDAARVISKEDLLEIVNGGSGGSDNGADKTQLPGNLSIVDARARERFDGLVEEPRPGMRKGHIPGSRCIPFISLLDQNDGRMKAEEEIRMLVASLTDKDQVISSCGSGVTACVLALAMASIGLDYVRVYDGSWSEWGMDNGDTPVEVSAVFG